MANFVSPNQIQIQIGFVLLVLTDTKIRYHYGKMANGVSPNQIQIQIRLVLLVRPDTHDDMSQPLKLKHFLKFQAKLSVGIRVPITMQNFAPLKSPLNILVTVLLRKFSKDFSKDFSKEQNFAS